MPKPPLSGEVALRQQRRRGLPFPVLVPLIQRREQAAQADVHRAQVGDLVDLQLGVELAALLQDLAGLVGGDGIDASAEGDELHQIHILLGGAVLGRCIQAAVIGPLVQDAGGELFHPVRNAVLGDDGSAVAGDEVVDAVVDLRVHMVGASGQHDDAPALTLSLIHI